MTAAQKPVPVRQGLKSKGRALSDWTLKRFYRLGERKAPLHSHIHREHGPILRLTNVRAIIVNGHLASSKERENAASLPYEEIIYCGYPCCDKVFSFKLADPEDVRDYILPDEVWD